MSQDEIGEVLGVSKMTISRALKDVTNVTENGDSEGEDVTNVTPPAVFGFSREN